MRFDQLGKTTQKTYHYIVKFISEQGHGPTIREIRSGLGFNSTSTPSYHRDLLADNGFITFDKEKPRSIQIVGSLSVTFFDSDAAFIRDHFGDRPVQTMMDVLRGEVGVMEHGS